MKFLNSGNVIRLALDQIEVGSRMRRVSDVGVENLMLMAEDTGITTPIHVRKVGATYALIDGAHRLAAAKKLDLPDIAVLVWECRQDEARTIEASNNLGAAGMTPLQKVVFVASWRRDYYALHPDRKPGVFKGNQHSGKVVTAETAVTRSIADAFGIKERQAFDIQKAGDALSAEEITLLDGDKRVSLLDLLALAKADPELRPAAVRAFVADPKLKLSRALKSPVSPRVEDTVEAEFKALRNQWSRVSKAAQRRFVAEHEGDLSRLLDEIGGGDA